MSLSLSAFKLFFRSAQNWRTRRNPTYRQLDLLIERLTRLDPTSRKNLEFEEIEGVRCAVVGKQFAQNRLILFIHGGGFALCGIGSHYRFLRFLSESTDSCVIFPEYTKTPEMVYPSQLNQCLSVMGWIQKQYPSVNLTLMGDSAGGNLAVSMVYNRPLALPTRLILLSPWLDLTGQILEQSGLVNDDVFGLKEVSKYAALYYGENDPADPSISPLNALLPTELPTLILSTQNEIFHPIIAEYVRRNRTGKLVHIERQGLFHVWPLFVGVIPEATRDAKLICEFVMKEPSSSVVG